MSDMTLLDELLSESEKKVYNYIKEQTEGGVKYLKQSFKEIGLTAGTSEASAHRAIHKLKQQGIIAIVPSQDKTEPNMIKYFGLTEMDKQLNDMINSVGGLVEGLSRLAVVMSLKDQRIQTLEILMKEKGEEITKLKQLVFSLNKSLQSNGEFKGEIVNVSDLGNGTKAIIVRG